VIRKFPDYRVNIRLIVTLSMERSTKNSRQRRLVREDLPPRTPQRGAANQNEYPK